MRKPKNKFKHKVQDVCCNIYALWLFFFKYHGEYAVDQQSIYFFLFAFFLAFDILLLMGFLVYLSHPKDQLDVIGIVFFFIYPLLPIIAPVTGLIGVFTATPGLIKAQADMNSTLCISNYLFTLILQFYYGENSYYKMLTFLLILNKVALSAFGGVVIQILSNPSFPDNQRKIFEIFKSFKVGQEQLE
jgi:hypothetical protein